MVSGRGSPEMILTEPEVKTLIEEGTPTKIYEGKKVLVLTPDTTRTCPLPMMVRAIRKIIGTRCATLDFMVALGTHPPLPESKILSLPKRHQWIKERKNDHRSLWQRPGESSKLPEMVES